MSKRHGILKMIQQLTTSLNPKFSELTGYHELAVMALLRQISTHSSQDFNSSV